MDAKLKEKNNNSNALSSLNTNSDNTSAPINVIFVHGFGGSPLEHMAIRNFLKKNNNITPFFFNYKEKWGTISLNELAKRCADFIAANNITCIVGISQGGVIAALAIEKYGAKIDTCITICSPIHGTLVAKCLPFVGVKELLPTSKILEDLREKMKKSSCRYYAIWNPYDLVVFPGQNAKNDSAIECISIPSLGHGTTFFEKKTLQFCAKIIAQEFKLQKA